MIRLSEIDPASATDRLLETIGDDLGHFMSVLVDTAGNPEYPRHELRLGLSSLHAYAARGELGIRSLDWLDRTRVAYIRALWCGLVSAPVVDWAQDDPPTEVECIVRGYEARRALDKKAPITMSQLAILASLGLEAVRALKHRGELETVAAKEVTTRGRQPVMVPAKEARRFLAARGVPGF